MTKTSTITQSFTRPRSVRALFAIAILLLLSSCGDEQQEEFEINGEIKKCQIINAENCGLRVSCDDDTIYRCVTN